MEDDTIARIVHAFRRNKKPLPSPEKIVDFVVITAFGLILFYILFTS